MIRIAFSLILMAASLMSVCGDSFPMIQQVPSGASRVQEPATPSWAHSLDPASSRSAETAAPSPKWADAKQSDDIFSTSSLDALLKDVSKDLPSSVDALRSGLADSYDGKSAGYYQPIKNDYYPSYEKPNYFPPASQGYKKPIVPYSENLGFPLLDLLVKKVILKIVVSFVLLFKKIIPLLLLSFLPALIGDEIVEKPKAEYPQQPVYPEYPVDNYKPPPYLQSSYYYKPPTRPYKPLGGPYRPPMPYDRSSSSNQKP